MRATTRFALIAAACGAAVLALSLRTSTAQPSEGQGRGEIATVDVVMLLEEMLQSPEYLEPREAIRKKITDELAEGEQQLMALETEIRAMPQNDPTRNQKIAEYQQLQQSLTLMTQTKAAEYDRDGAKQAVAIYNRVTAAADTVGQRMGYRYVMASRGPDASMNAEGGLTAVTQQILARPVIFGAENDDITAKVRAELGLPEPGADDADNGEAEGENAGG